MDKLIIGGIWLALSVFCVFMALSIFLKNMAGANVPIKTTLEIPVWLEEQSTGDVKTWGDNFGNWTFMDEKDELGKIDAVLSMFGHKYVYDGKTVSYLYPFPNTTWDVPEDEKPIIQIMLKGFHEK